MTKDQDKVEQEDKEKAAAWSDYLKHLTTLSTGAIVLISVFVEKFAPHPHYRAAVIASLLGFLAAILGSLAVMTALMIATDIGAGNAPQWAAKMAIYGMYVAWAGFAIGISSLTLFTLENLPR